MEEKKIIRSKIKELKRNFTLEEKLGFSERVTCRIEQLDVFKNAKCILAYWSMNDEVNTHIFVNNWFEDKTILLPQVVGDDLKLRKFEGIDKMQVGESFGILEPVGEEFTDFEKIDMIIVPGVAFDSKKNRLGRGKAYYDKLLKSCTNAVKIGIGFDFQIIDNVPVESHDLPMDIVVSETEVIE